MAYVYVRSANNQTVVLPSGTVITNVPTLIDNLSTDFAAGRQAGTIIELDPIIALMLIEQLGGSGYTPPVPPPVPAPPYKDLVRDYGASGSANTYTGSMTAGSNVLTIPGPLSSPPDFQVGQGIVVPHAGGGPWQNGSTTALLEAPTGLTIATTGTVGAGYTYEYYVVAVNANGGCSAASSPVSVTITDSSLSQSIYNTVSFDEVLGASAYILYGAETNPAGSQGYLFSSNDGNTPVNLQDRGPTNYFAVDRPSWTPASSSMPSAALGDFLVSTVAGLSGSSITLQNAALSSSGSQTIYHDDTQVINNAISSCSATGFSLYIPAGTYGTFRGITGMLSPSYYANTAISIGASLTDFRMFGEGNQSVFQLLPGSVHNCIQFGACTDCIFEKFVIDGNFHEQVWDSFYEVEGNGLCFLGPSSTSYSERVRVQEVQVRNTGQSGIRFGIWDLFYGIGFNPAGGKDCTILGCQVIDAHDQGYAVWMSDGVTVESCVADGHAWAGICLTYSTNCVVSGNNSRNNYWSQHEILQGGVPHGFGVAVEGGSGHVIANNSLVDNMQAGVYIHNWFGNNTAAESITVSGNSIVWTGTSTHVDSPNGVQLQSDNNAILTHVVVVGNTVLNPKDVNNNGTGVLIGGGVDGASAIANTIIGAGQQGILSFSDALISENSIRQSGNDGIKLVGGSSTQLIGGTVVGNRVTNNNGPGVHLNNAQGVTASSNECESNGQAAIQLQTVSTCVVADNVASNTSNNPGIQLFGTTTGNMIRGNLCIDTQTTHTQTYGIQEQSGVTGNVYEGNTFSGNTTGTIQFASGSTSVARNNLGYNPVGALTAPTVGASPWTYTNSNNMPATLYLSGGTVTEIAQYGTALGLTAGAFPLEPGQSVTVTYTAAPTVALIGA